MALEDIQNQNTLRLVKINKFKLIADIILILVLICIGFYVYKNIEEFKSLSSDVCVLCQEKTGATCVVNYHPESKNSSEVVYEKINASEIFSQS